MSYNRNQKPLLQLTCVYSNAAATSRRVFFDHCPLYFLVPFPERINLRSVGTSLKQKHILEDSTKYRHPYACTWYCEFEFY